MKKEIISKNYLEKIPVTAVEFEIDQKELVVLRIENTGIANKIAQKLFKRPRHSFIHLDEFGSFVWKEINGESDIIAIGKAVKEHFGEKAEPLYERLAKYFKTLESYKFITFK